MERILTECEDRSMIEEIFENNRIQARPEGLTQEANCAEKQPELTQQQRYVEKQKRLQFCLSDKSLINYLRQNNIILPQTTGDDGYRTSLADQIMDIMKSIELPKESLIFVDSVSRISICDTHRRVRTCEKDLKLLANVLLERVRI